MSFPNIYELWRNKKGAPQTMVILSCETKTSYGVKSRYNDLWTIPNVTFPKIDTDSSLPVDRTNSSVWTHTQHIEYVEHVWCKYLRTREVIRAAIPKTTSLNIRGSIQFDNRRDQSNGSAYLNKNNEYASISTLNLDVSKLRNCVLITSSEAINE